MARLNEPMVSTDSVETLRRKFLRQNRDIARVNSTQSLKIRSLENECVRLLSENLDLRGQVLRLQTELEDSKAQKIADHALEIKEKMEAQLAEWGTMLAGLGHEPIPKSRSPRESKKAKHRSSIGRMSMSEWKRRDTMNSSSMKDLEAAAAQEGRLAPIWENKPCPRETLTRDEILALRSVVDDNDDSPDLGPPPVSRFVDEDPVKIDLPARRLLPTSDYSPPEKPSYELEAKPESPSSPKVDVRKDEAINDATTINIESQDARSAMAESPTNNTVKAGLKRKQREEDEKENTVISRLTSLTAAVVKEGPGSEKAMNVKPRTLGRPIKPPSSRKEARDKTSASAAPRKPLSAKSSNEYIKSPKKNAKPSAPEEVTKDDLKPKKNPTPVEIPLPPPQSPEPVAVMNVEIETETETLSAEPNLAVPDTPEPMPRDEVRDTPPPTDISSRGETSRGSRRARAAVSYAEPNLRDKMRRPSKQLLDAVSGEGKNIRRTSQSSSGPSSVVKSEEKAGSWKDLPSAHSARSTPDVMASPLAQKGSRNSSTDDLSTSVVVNRKTRNPQVVGDVDSSSLLSGSKSGPRSTNRRLHDIAAREAEVAQMFDDSSDIYDIPQASPIDNSKRARESEDAIIKKISNNKGARRSRSRRLSSVLREDLDVEPEAQSNQKGSRQAGSSRRATMATSKESKIELEHSVLESSVEGDSLTSTSSAEPDGSTRDRAATRRRSMML
ncbi:uncharacterized protein GGS22DRAFT_195750 [Annulohypoxylon maeteangense]|uniref:uncharacterized protein n=1 Tax=Annulohypoxylon maeteangense TaxID=1927788 RepID=UPI002008BE7B|nr:uncharacterized protein GGS22DRAFT_195750 [Annulohypoxylon maeteangense]KAI0882469.1 hypothetical protein GGS22DRAFT_195750 [Annulohypoxylon maeteangense]